MKVSILNVVGDDESDSYGLENIGSQYENTLWNMMGGNESD